MKKGLLITIFAILFLFSNVYGESDDAEFSPFGVSVTIGGSPILVINSPLNITYFSNESLSLNVSHNADYLWYNIDGGVNISFNGLTYFNVSEGSHTVYVFGNNSDGESGENVTFNINSSIPHCGDSSCNAGEDCSSCSVDCGVCPDDNGDDGENGGSGSGSIIDEEETSFEIDKEEFVFELNRGEGETNFLEIKNTGETSLTFIISFDFFDNMIEISESEFTLEPNEVKIIEIDFMAPDELSLGEYLGEIIIIVGEEERRILISIDVIEQKENSKYSDK